MVVKCIQIAGEETTRELMAAFGDKQVGAMAVDQSATTESGSSEGDQTSTCVLNPGGVGNAAACETSMWEEWTQATSTGDEVSTSNFLPELTSSTSSRLSFQQSDMLATWMSSFHPLAQSSLSPDLTSGLMHEPGLGLDPSDLEVDAEHMRFHWGTRKPPRIATCGARLPCRHRRRSQSRTGY